MNPDSAVDVRAAFRRVGFDIDTTRSWVIKDHRPSGGGAAARVQGARPVALGQRLGLADEWVRDGRFRSEFVPGGVVSGRWASRGGGALQIPRSLRRAVVADPGHVLVVADAAQLEPRILAAMSGRRCAAAGLRTIWTCTPALADDGFGGDRAQAKVAMLGAMYGATTGESGRLLATLRDRYPAAMAFVESAARRGERGEVVHSVLGRACPPPSRRLVGGRAARVAEEATDDERRTAERLARDRGRFTRNFVVQASAADWAAVWLSGLRRDLFGRAGRRAGVLPARRADRALLRSRRADRSPHLTVAAADAARELVFPGSGSPRPSGPSSWSATPTPSDGRRPISSRVRRARPRSHSLEPARTARSAGGKEQFVRARRGVGDLSAGAPRRRRGGSP